MSLTPEQLRAELALLRAENALNQLRILEAWTWLARSTLSTWRSGENEPALTADLPWEIRSRPGPLQR